MQSEEGVSPTRQSSSRNDKPVSSGLRAYIAKKLAENRAVSNPKEVCTQIIFAIENGQLKGETDLHSANAALKMVRGDIWRKNV